jgi:hypothetical protein
VVTTVKVAGAKDVVDIGRQIGQTRAATRCTKHRLADRPTDDDPAKLQEDGNQDKGCEPPPALSNGEREQSKAGSEDVQVQPHQPRCEGRVCADRSEKEGQENR